MNITLPATVNGQILPGFAADNSAAIHFADEQPLRAICSQPTAKAYRVGLAREQITEEALEMVDVRII